MATPSTKNQPAESKGACALCGKPAPLACGRCRLAHYCAAACQRAAWPAHKDPCRRAGALRALPDVPADLPEKVAALATRGLTEVFVGPKGRGLRARAPIPRGTVVAYYAGPRYENDAAIGSMREFEYLLAGIAGDVATDTPCLPDAVNGSLINDPLTAETYGLLTQGELAAALIAYCCRDVHRRNAEALEPTVGNTTEIYTIRDVAAGEELLITYGAYYWVQMLAGKRLAGATFRAAWAANQLILRGDTKCFTALLEIAKLTGAPREQQAAFLDSALGGFGAAVPLWLKWEGVRVAYCGVVGVSFHGFCPPPEVENVYVRAPWDAREEKAPGKDLAVRAVILLARGLLPLAVSLSDQHFACEVVRQLLRELPGIHPALVEQLPEAVVLHGLADTILEAMDGRAPPSGTPPPGDCRQSSPE